MERVLITGALGQLGQEFIKFFIKKNIYVLASDIRTSRRKIKL
jgi:dTDP-4-dehydrorhamnose reductase